MSLRNDPVADLEALLIALGGVRSSDGEIRINLHKIRLRVAAPEMRELFARFLVRRLVGTRTSSLLVLPDDKGEFDTDCVKRHWQVAIPDPRERLVSLPLVPPDAESEYRVICMSSWSDTDATLASEMFRRMYSFYLLRPSVHWASVPPVPPRAAVRLGYASVDAFVYDGLMPPLAMRRAFDERLQRYFATQLATHLAALVVQPLREFGMLLEARRAQLAEAEVVAEKELQLPPLLGGMTFPPAAAGSFAGAGGEYTRFIRMSPAVVMGELELPLFLPRDVISTRPVGKPESPSLASHRPAWFPSSRLGWASAVGWIGVAFAVGAIIVAWEPVGLASGLLVVGTTLLIVVAALLTWAGRLEAFANRSLEQVTLNARDLRAAGV